MGMLTVSRLAAVSFFWCVTTVFFVVFFYLLTQQVNRLVVMWCVIVSSWCMLACLFSRR